MPPPWAMAGGVAKALRSRTDTATSAPFEPAERVNSIGISERMTQRMTWKQLAPSRFPYWWRERLP
jgi:hypothetical protein